MGLRIWHPWIDPAEITRELGLHPTNTVRADATRNKNAESYWSCVLFEQGIDSQTAAPAEDLMAHYLQWLTPHGAYLQRLRSEGARLNLEIRSFARKAGHNYAFVLPPELLRLCADLGLSLVHDVYGVAQNWQRATGEQVH